MGAHTRSDGVEQTTLSSAGFQRFSGKPMAAGIFQRSTDKSRANGDIELAEYVLNKISTAGTKGRILYTSDLHFGHKSVIFFDHRPFLDVDEMDRTLISLWNMRVQKDDTVYILGDFCYKSSRAPEWYLRQLKGHKVLVIGNHDGPILDSPRAMHYLEDAKPMMSINDGGRQVRLCHFPLAEWEGSYRGAWHVHGHIHNRRAEAYEYMRTKGHALNAGCMLNGFAPVSFEELIRNNKKFQEEGEKRIEN